QRGGHLPLLRGGEAGETDLLTERRARPGNEIEQLGLGAGVTDAGDELTARGAVQLEVEVDGAVVDGVRAGEDEIGAEVVAQAAERILGQMPRPLDGQLRY